MADSFTHWGDVPEARPVSAPLAVLVDELETLRLWRADVLTTLTDVDQVMRDHPMYAQFLAADVAALIERAQK